LVAADILGGMKGQIKLTFDYSARARLVTRYPKRNEKFHPRQDQLNSDVTTNFVFNAKRRGEVTLLLKNIMGLQELESAREIARGYWNYNGYCCV